MLESRLLPSLEVNSKGHKTNLDTYTYYNLISINTDIKFIDILSY